MTNLTLSIDEHLLRRARIRALEDGTSVNAVLRAFLEEYVRGRASLDAAIDRILAASRRSRARRGGRTWTREELYD